MPIFASRFDLSRYAFGSFQLSSGGGASAPPPPGVLATWFPTEAHDGSVFPVAPRYVAGGYTSDYHIANFRGAGAAYYVATTGSDSNDGSVGAPLRTFAAAEAAASAGDVIHVAAGRYAPLVVTKDGLTILAPGAIFGELLTEAEITWGALTGGRQTAALAAGVVDGFVDTTVMDGGFAQVAQRVADAPEADAFQTAGDAVLLEGATATLGASDGRDLSGLADSDVLAWSSTAGAPLVIGAAVSVTIQGALFVGGAAVRMAATHSGLLLLDGCQRLGGRGQLMELLSTSGGRSILSGGCYRGSRRDDVLDYRGTQVGVELGILCDQAGTAFNDNTSTAHDSAKMLRLGGTYRDGARTIHDINTTTIYMAGCTIDSGEAQGEDLCLRCGTGTVGHYAEISFAGTRSFDNEGSATFYDQLTDGVTVTGTPAAFTWVNLPEPNQAPVVASAPGAQTGSEDTLFALDVSGVFTDPDLDALTLSVATDGGVPGTAEIVGGEFRFTPGTGQTGAVVVTLTADDGNGGSASTSFTLTIAAAQPTATPHLDLRVDTSSLYQDAGQTVPAVADGDTVQSIVAGGVTLTADTATLVLRDTGSERYLEFDGSTKLSVSGFAAATSSNLMALAVVRTSTPGSNGTILLGAASGDYLFRMSTSGDAARDAGPGVQHYVDGGSATTLAATLQPAAQDGADHVISAYPLDLSAGDWTSPIVGGFSNANFTLNGRLYALVIAEYDAPAEAALRAELGALAGL